MFVEEKINSGYYKNKMDYPSKPILVCQSCGANFGKDQKYCGDCGIFTNFLNIFNIYNKAIKIYRSEERNNIERFKKDLFEEYGLTDYIKNEKVFSYAWDRGYSSGFHEVLNCFEEIVQLLPDEV